MKFRQAHYEDLPALKSFFQSVVLDMNNSGISIWNEQYPYEVLTDDIELKWLYLSEEDEITSVFAVCNERGEKEFVQWKEPDKKSVYIYRLAVNPKFSGKGIASEAIKFIENLARINNAEYIRLLVVDINTPAINLYLKNGFLKVDGVYHQEVEKGKPLTEFGYEKKVIK